jgi:DNA-binding MarR family transcriptional regulator
MKEPGNHAHWQTAGGNSLDISGQQYRAMMFLRDNPGASPARLSAFLSIRLSLARKLVCEMVNQKVVKNNRDPDDRAMVALTLTARGKSLLNIMDSEAAGMACLACAATPLPAERFNDLMFGMAILA